MGLRQNFFFTYESVREVEEFIHSFNDNFHINKSSTGLYIFSPKGVNSSDEDYFSFEVAPETFGLYSDRSGSYFEFLGIFIEALTGKFGKVEIDDL